MTADKKLDQKIALELDLRGASGQLVTVREICDRVKVSYPARNWHPSVLLEAEDKILARAVKQQMQMPLSEEYVNQHLPNILHKDRNLLGELPTWIYVKQLGKWSFSLTATPEHWESAADMRTEMGRDIIEQGQPYRDKADLLRHAGANCILELLTKRKTAA